MWIEKLYPEQRPAFEFVCSRAGAIILGDTAVGKTFISLAAIEYLRPRLLMIVAPLTSLDITWAPKLTTLHDYVFCRDLESIRQVIKTTAGLFNGVLLIHFQLFAKLAKQLERVLWDMVIIDESQGIKDRGSDQSRAARRMRHAKRRLALSATPLDKSPIDIWAQMRFIDPDVLGLEFARFKAEYCYMGGFKDREVKFHRHKLPELLQKLEPYVFRLEKRFLQLKPLHIHPVPVEMLGRQRQLYNAMSEHGIIELSHVTIPAPLAVTRQAKLEQITGGTIKDLDERSHIVGMAKARRLRTLTKRLGTPLVVFCKYLAEIPLIEAALPQGDRVEVLTGAVVGNDRTQLINDFQAGKVDYLICQMRTGGVSIELTAAANMVFYSMNFSLIDFTQVIGRLHRGSQTSEVNIYILYASNSVDEKIIREIEEKKDLFFSVVDHFKPQPESAVT
jgi:SNF2 family DNA or RNA helicase